MALSCSAISGICEDTFKLCSCTPPQIQKYRNKVSGSILGIFDIIIEVPAVPTRSIMDNLAGNYQSEPIKDVQLRIRKALKSSNCELDQDCMNIMETAQSKLGLSAGVVWRIIKISRSIASLEGSEKIEAQHIAEAIQYRVVSL